MMWGLFLMRLIFATAAAPLICFSLLSNLTFTVDFFLLISMLSLKICFRLLSDLNGSNGCEQQTEQSKK